MNNTLPPMTDLSTSIQPDTCNIGNSDSCGSTKCRYQRIQMMGITFVILSVILLGSKIFLSSKIAENTTYINLTGKQSTLTQQMTKSSMSLQEALNANDSEATERAHTEFSKSYKLFDETLLAFRNGNEELSEGDKSISVSAMKGSKLQDLLKESSYLWSLEQSSLSDLAESDFKSVNLSEVESVVIFLRDNNQKLLGMMNSLAESIENDSHQKSFLQGVILWAVIGLTIGLFVYLSLFAINGLRKRDAQLADSSKSLKLNYNSLVHTNAALERSQFDLYNSNLSLEQALESVQQSSYEAQNKADELQVTTNDLNQLKEESDTIFDAVDHGLCLLDSNAIIGSRVSKATYNILETENIVSMSFIDLMRPLIAEKDLKTLKNYIKLQFNPKTKTKQLLKYNPLKSIEVTMNWDGNNFKTKNLGFDFERIMDGDIISSVLVTITDISETIILENELKRTEVEQQRRTSIILEAIQSDSSKLNKFLSQTRRVLDDINHSLKENGLDEDEATSSKNMLEDIFRQVHNIKGNASLLGLKTVVLLANEVESDLDELRTRPDIKGQEFLSALLQLGTLRDYLEYYQEVTDNILKDFLTPKTVIEKATIKPRSQSEQLKHDLSAFVKEISLDLDKEVYTRCKFDLDTLSSDGVDFFKDIMIQLARNSVSHGIESPQTRLANNKVEEATISAICKKDSTSDNILNEPAYTLTFRDDGAGVDLEAVKAKALSIKIITEEEANDLSDLEVAGLIFKPSFSSLQENNNHAGRGVGLDLVKDKVVNEYKGKMFINFVPGSHTQFNFIIPAVKVEENIKEKIG